MFSPMSRRGPQTICFTIISTLCVGRGGIELGCFIQISSDFCSALIDIPWNKMQAQGENQSLILMNFLLFILTSPPKMGVNDQPLKIVSVTTIHLYCKVLNILCQTKFFSLQLLSRKSKSSIKCIPNTNS